MKTIKKLTAILSCIAVTGSLAATVAATENDVTTNVTIKNIAVANGYKGSSSNQDKDLYDSVSKQIQLGGDYNGNPAGYLNTKYSVPEGAAQIICNQTDDISKKDTNITYLKFDIPADATAADAYKLSMTSDGYGHNTRTANIDIYAGIVNVNTAVVSNTSYNSNGAPGPDWTSITWLTRPAVTKVEQVATNIETAQGKGVTLDLTSVLKNETGTVTVALMGTATTGSTAKAHVKYINLALTRTVPAAEPTFTASVVPDTFFTVNGTGKYEAERASGFIAEITSDKSGASPTSLTLYVNGDNKGTQNFKDTSGITGNIHVGIIVSEIIKNENDIRMIVK